MSVYKKYIQELQGFLSGSTEQRFAAQQLLCLHEEACKKDSPLIVELGVDRGQSTKVFLNAISGKPKAKLISLDIRDCSAAAESEQWHFVQQNSADINTLLQSHPEIKQGIDLLYVDSLHTQMHVKAEIYGFFEYLNKGAVVFFDDVESTPYMQGQRKDSIGTEVANRKILQLLEAIFRANYHALDFSLMMGSTGLAKFIKRTALGDKLNDPVFLRSRNFQLLWKILDRLGLKSYYQHSLKTNDSFLIDPTSEKYK